MDLYTSCDQMLNGHPDIKRDLPREEMTQEVLDNREAFVAANGCLATWTRPESTGRSPKDTVIVRSPEVEQIIDWDSPNNIPLDVATFDELWHDAVKVLEGNPKVYVTHRVVGADPSYALPVETITNCATTALFTMNMFRPPTPEAEKSIFANRGFRLLALPMDKVAREKYIGRLRKLPGGETSNMVIAMDFGRRLGLVFGSAYLGSVKKLIFTVMNYYLPLEDLLPLHCSANEDANGTLTLFLGLSGTGKTTLSADPARALLGDDEHGWSDNGIANFEFGCYAKLIDLNPEKEPEIYHAVFHKDDVMKHGAIVENAMMYPDGKFDLFDDRLTPNSRASYPLTSLHNIKNSSMGSHPDAIIFLTADANGVLPPIALLGPEAAMLWFLMGYTSKLAGTETGIVDPVSTFSRFFGQPFMPCLPHYYSDKLGERMKRHGTRVYLINTGWSGGPFGVGERMDITLTRLLVDAAISGELEKVEHHEDRLFHLKIPATCPGVPAKLLDPKLTWADPDTYDKRAKKLAGEFAAHFKKAYGDKKIDQRVKAKCPGL